MKIYDIIIGCTVQAYAHVEVEAEDEAEAERRALDAAEPSIDCIFEPEWSDAEDYRIVDVREPGE